MLTKSGPNQHGLGSSKIREAENSEPNRCHTPNWCRVFKVLDQINCEFWRVETIMSHTTKVSVFENGKPAKGRNVSLEFWEGMTKGFITDDSGTACVDHESTGHVKVYVDGNYSNHRTTGDAPGHIKVSL